MITPTLTDERAKELIVEFGGSLKKIREAGHPLGMYRFNRLRAEMAQKGVSPEQGLTREAAPGFVLKGHSDFVDEETGKITRRWLKYDANKQAQHDLMLTAIKGMAEDLPRVPRRKPLGADYRADLMACYPIGDAHIGMLSWPEETGEDWNLELAEQIQCGAMAELVDRAPACEKATIVNLGDWFHADNVEGQTSRSKHSLDMDGRYAKMIRVGVKVMRQCIESALAKHKTVHVINIVGNHDDTGAMFLSVCLANIYEAEPRVTVDTSPAPAMYFRHGKVFVGCHHGHSIKAGMLPGVMAADRPQDWGESRHRYWWVGHIHHQSLKDFAGVTVESFRTLAAKDAYASWGGYRSPRDMKCIVLHEEHGEVARHTVNPAMVSLAQGV